MSAGTRKHRKISIIPASVTDSAAIATVCLLTANQGRSAETLVQHRELPSQVRALPYLHFPSGFGFLLVESVESVASVSKQVPPLDMAPRKNEAQTHQEQHEKEPEERNVVGYVVGTTDIAQFAREVDEIWWPFLREKYPKNLIGTPLDRYFIGLIHKGGRSRSTGPAQIHVNVIGKYKAHGCDRLLLDVALNHLRKQERANRSTIAASL